MSTGFVLFRGPAPVSTADAVRRYFGWKERNPGAAQDFLRDSNRAIQSFLSSRSTEESLSWFERSRRLGVELGTAIGVPGEIAVAARPGCAVVQITRRGQRGGLECAWSPPTSSCRKGLKVCDHSNWQRRESDGLRR